MSVLVLTGELFNVIYERYGTSGGGTPSPAADSLFPAVNAHSGGPGEIFKFGSVTAAPTMTYDLDFMLGLGNMESRPASGPNVGWTNASTGTGAVSRTVTSHAGAFGATYVAGTGTAVEYKDFTVRSGQRLKIDTWIRGDGDAACEVRIQNLQTANYLTAAGAWSATPQTALANASTSYSNASLTFTVEDYATCRSDTVVLRVSVGCLQASGTAYADDLIFIPAVKFASVHGHNIDPRCGLTVRSSTDNFSSSDTLRATFTVLRQSFYATFSEVFERYWRFAFTGTQSDRSGAIWIGEWVLGEHLTLSRGPLYPMSLPHSDPQIQVSLRVGAPGTYRVSQFYQRTFPIAFQAENMTQRLQILREVFDRSLGGRPLVVVPHDADSFTEVIMGKLAPGLPHEWTTRNVLKMETEFTEMAFPLITS